MATATFNSCVERIGETAGAVWRVLAEDGPANVTNLVKATGQRRETVLEALGWLAREDKISIEEQGRSRIISLC